MGCMETLIKCTEFYSDGTLGPFSGIPNLEVGGWGWGAIDAQGHPIAGVFGTLEGEIQTVPRAELMAVLSILERVPAGIRIVVKVDATYLLGFYADPEDKAKQEKGDLWFECYRLLAEKHINWTSSRFPGRTLATKWSQPDSSLSATEKETPLPMN